MQKTILVVDDEKDIVEMLQYNLEKEGYKVLTARNGKQALEQVKKHVDLILLDIMMTEMNGLDVLRELKRVERTKSIPVVFLTAKGSEVDEVIGLELGAEDYIVKPISIKKLIARVRTAIRRDAKDDAASEASNLLRIDDLEINVPNYTVTLGAKGLVFPKKEFETLVYLVRHRGRVISRDVLLNAVWGEGVFVVDRTVDVHIRKIREKLGKYADMIETVKGVGYRFKA
ncbi:MAG TPA: response regulator transcription factor [Bacteroidota bacterium]|nr:response regulator transcription factor [Bacteroidota bacterium]